MFIRYRSVPVCVILTILTCGLYAAYWLYALGEDLHYATDGRTSSGFYVLILSLVTCGIYFFYWLYNAGSELDFQREKSLEPSGHFAILFLALGIFQLGIIALALIQDELNRYAAD